MSSITYLELVYGAWKSEDVGLNMAAVEQLARMFPIEPLNVEVGQHYGRVRTELERRGLPIGAHDLLIAAHALALRATVVTGNIREFTRVEGLNVENWAD